MQAVLLVGGLGTRLRPLTYTRPKPLLPLLNRPVVFYILDILPDSVDEVIVPVSYMSRRMRDYFNTLEDGRNYVVIHEVEPLGTGGALRNVSDHLSDDFLVFNGDIVSSIDIESLVEFHREKGGVGTISLWEVENPEAFGIVKLDEDDRITMFKEKPRTDEIVSNKVNAGIYVLNESVLEDIPAEKVVSLEREVFPEQINNGLYGFGFEGYWVDCGTTENFLRASSILMDYFGSSVSKKATIAKAVTEEHPVVIGDGTKILDGEIGPRACLGRDIEVRGASISESVIMDSVSIGKGVKVAHSIIGKRCVVPDGCLVERSMIADDYELEKGDQIIDRKVGMR
ncbi:MAG: sugar phosphate nucleotidyltransferase [Thermoplasmata archaeon]